METNGLLVVEKTSSWYHGVDRYVWPLQYDNLEVHTHICSTDLRLREDLPTQDILLAKVYKGAADKLHVPVDLLYCEFIETDESAFDESLHEKVCNDIEFLGWDFSYASGDFYSCIYNDFSLHPALFSDIVQKLNKYGLFSCENDLDEYISLRDTYVGCCPKPFFEIGPFYKVRVYLVLGGRVGMT